MKLSATVACESSYHSATSQTAAATSGARSVCIRHPPVSDSAGSNVGDG